jgi:hypothetical protein
LDIEQARFDVLAKVFRKPKITELRVANDFWQKDWQRLLQQE